MSAPPRVSVIVPTWNGGRLLSRGLPGLARQARKLAGGAEVLVVDDATTLPGDRSEQVVTGVGPPARWLPLDRHRGFAATCNAGARAARGRLLAFVNSDMHLDADCLEVLAAAVENDAELFAATPVIDNQATGRVESGTRLRLRRGLLDVLQSDDPPPAAGESQPVAYPCGGAMVCRRQTFLELGGFWEALGPFYWEDAELGLRAWRRGLASVQIGDARALHDHARTIGSHFTTQQVRRIYERNRLLVSWAHLEPAAAAGWTALRWVAALLRGRPAAWATPAALARRTAARARSRGLPPAPDPVIRAIASASARGWPDHRL
ncbi:MAG: glycosyltransferase [Acidobacteriota bacterium]|nr:glycosyltransferase [Acidobacteriota bacterium]